MSKLSEKELKESGLKTPVSIWLTKQGMNRHSSSIPIQKRMATVDVHFTKRSENLGFVVFISGVQ